MDPSITSPRYQEDSDELGSCLCLCTSGNTLGMCCRTIVQGSNEAQCRLCTHSIEISTLQLLQFLRGRKLIIGHMHNHGPGHDVDEF